MAKKYPQGFLDDFEVTARVEGGYTDHPDDPGGPTFTGVTLRTYNRYFKWASRNAVVPAARSTKEQMRAHLERDPSIVKDIFLNLYWRKVKASRIHPGARLMLYDAMVLGGVRGIKTIQGVLRIKRDGIVGPQTLAAIRAEAKDKHTLEVFVTACAKARLEYLQTRKHWETFGRGWTRRIDYVHMQCLWRINDSNLPGGLPPGSIPPAQDPPIPAAYTSPAPEPAPAAPAPRVNPIVRLCRWLFRRGD